MNKNSSLTVGGLLLILIFGALRATNRVSRLSNRNNVNSESVSSTLQTNVQRAQSLVQMGRASEAIVPARAALTEATNQFGPNHLNTGMIMALLGRALIEVDKCDEALPILQNSATILSLNMQDVDPRICGAYGNLAECHRRLGHTDEAAKLFDKVIGIEERTNARPVALATSYNNLALLLTDLGDYAGAEERFLKALNLVRERSNENDPLHVQVLYNYLDLGEGTNEELEEYANEAITIAEQIYGSAHEMLIVPLCTLASIRHETGALDEARSYYEKSWAIHEELNRAPDIYALLTLDGLGQVFLEKLDFDSARSRLNAAVELGARLKQDEPAEVIVFTYADSLKNLAMAERQLNQLEPALEHYKEGLAQLEEVLDSDHPALAVYCLGIADVLELLNRNDEAAPFAKRAAELAIEEEVDG